MNGSFTHRKSSGQGRSNSGDSGFLRKLESGLAERVEFFQAFIREPASVGALSPSSRALARAMIHGCPLQKADTVVEIGPGTGAFTGLIREMISEKTTFITLELDPHNARSLKRRFPDLIVYNDSAERMPDCLALHGKQKANFIISGLPWASLPLEVQERVMDAVLTSLPADGVFTTFAYVHARWLPKAVQFRRNLELHFDSVETSPVVWGNLPPAFVYRCTHSKRSQSERSASRIFQR